MKHHYNAIELYVKIACDIFITGIKILHQSDVKQYGNMIHSIYKVELEQNWHHSNHAVAY